MADLTPYQTVFRAKLTNDHQRKIIKRNRPPVSCIACRTRKQKCDRLQPCGACTKRGDADSCRYTTSSVSTSASPGIAPPRQEAQLRLQRLEELVNGLVSRSPASRADDEESPPQPPSEQSASSSAGSKSMSETLAGAPYLGATHWAAVLESIHDVQSYLEADSDSAPEIIEDPTPVPDTDGAPDLIFAPAEKLTTRDIIALLPPRAECDRLMSLFFQSKIVSVPFIHGAAFQRAYARMWANPPATSILWASILCSLLCIASLIDAAQLWGPSPTAAPGIAPTALPPSVARFRSLATRALLAGSYLAGRPFAVEALVMCAYVRLVQARDADIVLWSAFGQAARLAQRMGYHREPDQAAISPFAAEMRRRVWYMIETFDLLYSFQFGIPPIVHDEETDTRPPTNLLDEDFDEDSAALPAERPFTDPTPVLYVCFKSRHVRILRRVIRHALGSTTTDYEATRALGADLRRVSADVPPSLRPRRIRDTPFGDPPPMIMHRVTLELSWLKSVCVLHRAFLTYQKGDPTYEPSRRECREAALRILAIHEEFEEEKKPGGRLNDARHWVSSLTMHDFLVAATILCLDLTESVGLSPELKAIELEALQKAYRIWQSKKDGSKDAAHAARVLSAIIKKVSESEDLPPPPPRPPVDSVDSSPVLVEADSPPMNFNLKAVPEIRYDWMEMAPFDEFLNDPTNIDWNMVDDYLLDRQANKGDTGENVWSADLMAEGP